MISDNTTYGFKDEELSLMTDIFAANENVERVLLYGSRAKGTYKPFSDVDITLVGENLTINDLSDICSRLASSSLPYEFDISILKDLKNQALKEHIARVGKEIYNQ